MFSLLLKRGEFTAYSDLIRHHLWLVSTENVVHFQFVVSAVSVFTILYEYHCHKFELTDITLGQAQSLYIWCLEEQIKRQSIKLKETPAKESLHNLATKTVFLLMVYN